MSPQKLTITPQALANILRGSHGLSSPDGTDFDPRGPLGPIAYQLYMRLGARQQMVALNPQPIPPVDDMARMVAQAFVAEVIAAKQHALGSERSANVDKRIGEFTDWCGTGALTQRLVEWLRRLGFKGVGGGGEPVPRPNESVNAQVRMVIGAELYAARDFDKGLGAAGEALMQQGAMELG